MLKPVRMAPFILPVMLAACSSIPEGPGVTALPGRGKATQQFHADDVYCRQMAFQQSGGRSANDAAVDSGVRSAALGTLLGAAAGTLIGGQHSTEAGAGAGLVFGALAGAGAAEHAAYTTQQRYDVVYAQCMYDSGHRVPVSRHLVVERSRSIPPPPPNTPPPNMPPPPMANLPVSSPGMETLFVYPKNGQSEAQIAADRRKCSAWAIEQTGFDPARDRASDPRISDFKRASAACLESYGYSVK